MLGITQSRRRTLTLLTLLAVAAQLTACSGKGTNSSGTAAGAVDTIGPIRASSVIDTPSAPTIGVTPSAGPGAQVTATDAVSVRKAEEYQLTATNFGHFMAAADSIAALAKRDSATRAFLNTDITGSGSKEADAGLKWLESNTLVSNAINGAGISTLDYFVASIAIADAVRYMNDPKAAPPTPTGRPNAEFLRGHAADLQHLRSLGYNKLNGTDNP